MKLDPDQSAEIEAGQQLVRRGVLLDLFDVSQSLLFVADGRSHKIISANPAARLRLDKSLRQMRKCVLSDLVPDIPVDRVNRILAQVTRRRLSKMTRFRVQVDEKNPLSIGVLRVEGRSPSFVVVVSDDTVQARALARADEAQAQLTTAINALSDGFVLYDKNDRLVICNEPYKELYPKSAHMMTPGTSFRDILKAGLDRGEYSDAIGREPEWLAERLDTHTRDNSMVEQRLTSGRWLRIEERRTGDGGRVGLRVDITALKDQQATLRRMMLTDELTDLRNRRNLLADLHDWASRLADGNVIAVYHFDIERFKHINGVYGYDAGDALLQRCADILRTACAPDGLAARVGGNEFVLACEVPKNSETISQHAQDICAQISEPCIIDAQQVICSVSAGVAILTPNACRDGGGSILAAAEMALGEAKKIGRSVQIFRQTMQVRALNDSDLARDLQRAIEFQEFEAYFQPQVDAQSNRCIGFEALARWVHPEKGTLAAGSFLSIAQRSGLTEALDDLVIDRSCRALAYFERIGRPDLTVSVNLSANQVADSRLLPRLLATLRQHGIARDKIRLELLESTLLDDRTARYLENIESLVKAGFVMELDDFGTGHAAIASLRKFKVSQIKIDRSFVQNIDQDSQLQDLTAAIITLAQRLGIAVLAEGVETIGEQDCLLSMGCSRSQGWLYAKALPLGEIADFLKKFEAKDPQSVAD